MGIKLCNKIRLSKNSAVRDILVLMLTGKRNDFILKVSKQVRAQGVVREQY